MTGDELQKLRKRAGLSLGAFGVALGYGGSLATIARLVRRLEGCAATDLPANDAAQAGRFEDTLAQFEEKWAAEAKPDPRDPDYSREGMFQTHNCWKCNDGAKPCVAGSPLQCEYPHARND